MACTARGFGDYRAVQELRLRSACGAASLSMCCLPHDGGQDAVLKPGWPDPLSGLFLCEQPAAYIPAKSPRHTTSPPRVPLAGLHLDCVVSGNVRFGSKADIGACVQDVRFTPKSGHSQRRVRCPLSAKSGQRPTTRLRISSRAGGDTSRHPAVCLARRQFTGT